MLTIQNTSCIILSAGNSLRMGQHKALLRFNSEYTFVQKIIDTYSKVGINQIILVVNQDLFNVLKQEKIVLPKSLQIVVNEKPELGRFYSLLLASAYLHAGNSCFLQNIDNPFTSAAILNELIEFRDDAEVIIPSFQRKAGHPVLFNAAVAQKIVATNDLGTRIDEFLKLFTNKYIHTILPEILININSLDAYKEAGLPS